MSDIFRLVASRTSTIISATGGLSSILNHFSATKCHCISLEEFTHNTSNTSEVGEENKTDYIFLRLCQSGWIMSIQYTAMSATSSSLVYI